MLRKSGIIGAICFVILCLWIGFRGRPENPRIEFLLPTHFSGFIYLHTNNWERHQRSGRDVILHVGADGAAQINRELLINWHALKFVRDKTELELWHETILPADNKVRVYEFPLSEVPIPDKISDFKSLNTLYFVGTASEFLALPRKRTAL